MPCVFYFQWDWHPWVFLGYRIFAALWCTVSFLYLTLSTINQNLPHNIMAYLTVWTYLLLTIYHVTSVIATFVHGLEQNSPRLLRSRQSLQQEKNGITNSSFKDPEKNPVVSSTVLNVQDPGFDQETDSVRWYMKATWLLADVVNAFAIIVTLVYFVFLYPLIGKTNFIDINVHGLNSVLVLADAVLTARPVRLLHVLYPLIYGALYLIFGTIYWSMNKKVNVLYPGVLDWNHPARTAIVICMVCFVALPVLQLFHFGIYRLKLFVYKKLYGVEYS